MTNCDLEEKYSDECDDTDCDNFTVCDIDDDPGYCANCSGSGEGPYEGATCYKCHGSGVARREE